VLATARVGGTALAHTYTLVVVVVSVIGDVDVVGAGVRMCVFVRL
jgi:hypothetical protein